METHRRLSFDEYVMPGVPYRSTLGDVVSAVFYAVAAAALILVGAIRQPDPSLPLGQPWALWAGLGICAVALLFKRRAPVLVVAVCGAVAVATVLLVSYALPIVVFIALIDAVYAAMITVGPAQRRWVAGVCTATLAAHAVPALALMPLVEALPSIVGTGFVIALPLAWGTAVRQRDELVDSERERAAAVAAAADAEREAAVRAERGEIAGHLHDEIAARLAAISLQAGALQARAGEDPRFARAATAMRESSREALDELRRLIGVLAEDRRDDDNSIDDADPVAALRAQAAAFDATLSIDGAPGALPGSVAQALARIAKEAVANAARHAPGAPIAATFSAEGDAVTMTIANPLPGEPADAGGTGLGTSLMAERWRALGGSGSAGPDGSDWRVAATIPLHADSRSET